MDLCADQLLAHVPASVACLDVALPFARPFGRLPLPAGVAFNSDRLLNRHFLLPHHVRTLTSSADFIHIADHSYAHLALSLPADRTGVYCHDLDAFRCVLEPHRDRRPRWFRWLAGRALAGLRRATIVFHNSAEVGRQLREAGVVRPERLIHAPLGVAPEFTPAPNPAALPEPPPQPYLLHVGGDMPRKRLDVLLEVFAELTRQRPNLRLVQVGPPWSAERSAQIGQLEIGGGLVKFTGLTRPQLAELYRRAAAVLVPSESEGFGLPVIEALACGAPVLASDIPVLWEVGGPAVIYHPVADVPAWAKAISAILSDPDAAPPLATRLAQASRYSWTRHAETIVDAYRRLQRGRP